MVYIGSQHYHGKSSPILILWLFDPGLTPRLYYRYPLRVAEMEMCYSDIWRIKSLDISDRMRGDKIMSRCGTRRSADSIFHAIEGTASGERDDIVAVEVEEVK